MGCKRVHLWHPRRRLCAEGFATGPRSQRFTKNERRQLRRGRKATPRSPLHAKCAMCVAQLFRKQGTRLGAAAALLRRSPLILDPRMRCTARPRGTAVPAPAWPDYLHGCAPQKPAPLKGEEDTAASTRRRQRARFSVPLWAEHASAAPTS